MLRRTARSALALAVVAAALVAPAAHAADDTSSLRHQRAAAKFQQWLGLTPEQSQAIQEIRERQRGAAQQNRQALHQARQELRQMALRGADDGSIEAKVAQVEQLMGESVRLNARTLQEMAPILTEEQRQKMEQMGQFRHGQRHGRHS